MVIGFLGRIHPAAYLGLSLIAFVACLIPLATGMVDAGWVYVLIAWFLLVAVIGIAAFVGEAKKLREYRKVYLSGRNFFTLGGGVGNSDNLTDMIEKCILSFANMDRNPSIKKMPVSFLPKIVVDTTAFGFECEYGFQAQSKTFGDQLMRALGASDSVRAYESREIVVTHWSGGVRNLDDGSYKKFDSIDELELILSRIDLAA